MLIGSFRGCRKLAVGGLSDACPELLLISTTTFNPNPSPTNYTDTSSRIFPTIHPFHIDSSLSSAALASDIDHIMASTSASERIEGAKSLASKDPAKAEQIYRDVLSGGIGKTESASRDYEAALVGLGELYRDNKKAHELAELIKTSRDAFSSFAKAKTAKLGEFLSA